MMRAAALLFAALAAVVLPAHAFIIPGPAAPRKTIRLAVRMASDGVVGIGVLGCGRIGQIHSDTVAFGTPGAKLVAVADPFESAGKLVLEQTNNLPTYYKDYIELLDRSDIDAVIIGSPTPYHVEQILAAVERGKHVFCEKPVSNELDAIDTCVEAAAKAGKKLVLGFQRRFDVNFQAIKRRIQAGEIGDVRTIRIVSRDPKPPPAEYLQKSGGIFLDMTSHDFDMARFLVGSEIEEVYVQGAAFDPEAQAADDLDTHITLLKFANGAFGTIENSRKCSFGYDQRVEVFGEKGTLQGNNRSPDTVVRSDANGVVEGLPYSFFMDRYAEAYVDIVRAFIESIKGTTDGPSSFLASAHDGKATVVAGMAAHKSVVEKRPVKISEIGEL